MALALLAFMSKPIIALIGAPKLGKSTSAFKAFQNSLAIMSSENNAHFYKRWLTTEAAKVRLPNGELKYKPPKRVKLVDMKMVGTTKEEYTWLKQGDAKPTRAKYVKDEATNLFTLAPDPQGDQVMPIDQKLTLESTLRAVASKSLIAIDKGEQPPYDNIIIDELGEFMDRVHKEITPTVRTKKDEIDTRGAFGVTDGWLVDFVNDLKQLIVCGVGVCLVLHDREPDNGKQGGAKLPSAGMGRKLTAMIDGALRLYMKDPPVGAVSPDGKPLKSQRLWTASGTESWNIGLRGLLPDDEDIIGPMEVEEIIELAGFEMRRAA